MIAQGTPEWFAARLGQVTASKISDVMAKGRNGAPSATRATYMGQLVAERLTGEAPEAFTNAAMEWGTEHEAQARARYTMTTGLAVDEAPYVPHPEIAGSGASPDGFAGDDGLVEIKCPNTATHIDTLRGGSIKRGYLLQMQWQMACTGRAWCDFASFDPRLPRELSLKVTRVERDAAMIADIEAAVRQFLFELDALEAELRDMQVAA